MSVLCVHTGKVTKIMKKVSMYTKNTGFLTVLLIYTITPMNKGNRGTTKYIVKGGETTL